MLSFDGLKQASVDDISTAFHFFEMVEDPGNEFGKYAKLISFSVGFLELAYRESFGREMFIMRQKYLHDGRKKCKR